MLEITLKGNDFEFNSDFYLQILGTAMGKKYAPALANLYLQYFDHMAMNGFRIKPTFYKRFLDDLIIVWPGTKEELNEYNIFLNNLIPDITVTLKSNETNIDFLDTTIYRSKEDKTKLHTKVFFKETDSHQLLHTSSFHPKHTRAGVLKSQLIRFKRISSTFEDYSEACLILFNSLQKRGYSKSRLRKMKREIWQAQNKSLKKSTPSENDTADSMIPLILQYNQFGNKFMHLWKNIIRDNNLFKESKLVAAYSKNKNLSNYLVRARITKQINKPQKNEINYEPNPGFYTCNSARCLTCKFHATEQYTFKSTTYGRSFTIRQNLCCKSKNIIYLITCKKCNLQYVGETSRELRECATDHRSNICIKKRAHL